MDAASGDFSQATAVRRWDRFQERQDGPLASQTELPSGHTWVITGAPAGVPLGPELEVYEGALRYDSTPSDDPKAYMWTTGEPFTKFVVKASFGPGSTLGATIGVLVSPLATDHSNGPTGVATNSLHGSFTANAAWSVSIFIEGASFPIIASSALDGAYANLEVDEPYEFGLERVAVDKIRITLPTERVGGLSRFVDVTDAMILERTGQALLINDWWGTTALQEFFQPVATLATDRLATIYEYLVSGNGDPFPSPQPHIQDHGWEGADWLPLSGRAIIYRSGRYYGAEGAPATNLSLTVGYNGLMLLSPLAVIPRPLDPVPIFDAFALAIPIAATGGAAVLRCGIYAMDTKTQLPTGAPLSDETFDLTVLAANGTEVLLDPLNLPLGYYWRAAVYQGTPATAPTIVAETGPPALTAELLSPRTLQRATTGAWNPVCYDYNSTVAGALPNLTGTTEANFKIRNVFPHVVLRSQ